MEMRQLFYLSEFHARDASLAKVKGGWGVYFTATRTGGVFQWQRCIMQHKAAIVVGVNPFICFSRSRRHPFGDINMLAFSRVLVALCN